MVGDPRKQRTRRDIGYRGNRAVNPALFPQRPAEKLNRRIFNAVGEIQQYAVRAEIVVRFGGKILDAGKQPFAQQARPEIIGSHMHAPLILTDGRRCFDTPVIFGIGNIVRTRIQVLVANFAVIL